MSKAVREYASKESLATHIFVLSYFVLISGLILVNAISGIGMIDNAILLYIRSTLHIIPCIVFILLYVINKNKMLLQNKNYLVVRNLIASMMMFIVPISGLVNGMTFDGMARMLVVILHIFNLTVLLPLSISYINIDFSINKISKLYCWFLFVLCAFVLIYYVFGEKIYYMRLGYPYIPGVYAYMCLVALIVSVDILRRHIWGFFFIVNIFMSGSRIAFALGVLVYVLSYFSLSSIKHVVLLIMVLTSFAFAFNYYDDLSRPFLIQRADISSGRTGIWTDATDKVMESPYLGYYKQMTFGYNQEEEKLGAHNSFLDLSIQYGVFFSLLAYIYWFSYVPGIIKSRKIYNASFATGLLFLVVVVKSILTNTFWTNMGDGVTYFVAVMMTMITFGAYAGMKYHQ